MKRVKGNSWRSSRGIACCFFLLILPACATVAASLQKPEVQDVQSRITRMDFQGVRLLIDMDVVNLSPFTAKVEPSHYTLDINQQQFCTADINPDLSLAPKQSDVITFPIVVNYSDLERVGKEVSNASEVDYTVHGHIKMLLLGAHIDVPFSGAGKFPVLRPPSLVAVKVRLTDVSLSKAKLIADTEVTNPNVFDLGIRELTYELDLGSTRINGLKAQSEGTVAAGKKLRLTITGEISAGNGLINVLMNGVSVVPEVTASGFLQTPYGKVKL